LVAQSNNSFKGTITASAENGVATFRMSGGIGYSETCTSDYINGLIEGFIKKGIKHAVAYINTQGGSVFEANEIINEFKKFESFKIKAGALLASAGTLFSAKFHTTVKKNTRFMIHKPMAGGLHGNEDEIESNLKLLKDITSDYRKSYAEKSGKTEDEIEAMWAKGDCWMTAQEALKNGFIDAIEDSEQALTSEDIAMITASSCPDKPIIPPTKMDKNELIAMLGLAADATQDQINAAIKANKEAADAAKAKEQMAQSDADKIAATLVDKAITDKKITADQRTDFLGLAKANFESTKSVLEKMPAISAISNQLDIDSKGEKDEPAERKTWTLDDYLDKDPEALVVLESKNPERFKALNDDYYKKRN
jgi:ATP-dependent Clp protease, protease subunit